MAKTSLIGDYLGAMNVTRSGTHYVLTPGGLKAALRFEKSLLRPLAELSLALTDSETIVLCLIGFEFVLSHDDLRHAYQAMQSPVTYGAATFVEWLVAGGWRRRELSEQTMKFAQRCADFAEFGDLVVSLDAKLAAIYGTAVGADSAFDLVLADAAAYAFLQMPPALATVATGLAPSFALPPAAWRRRFDFAPRIIDLDAGFTAPELGMAGPLHDVALDVVATTSSLTQGQELIESLFDLTNGIKTTGSDGSLFKQRMALLLALESRVSMLASAGPYGALLFAWVTDLVLHGTATLADPRVGTIRIYLKNALHPLFCALTASGMHPYDMCQDDWSAVLRAAMGNAANPRLARAAIVSFRRFISAQFEPGWVEELAEDAHDRPVPRAQVIWPHEWPMVRSAIGQQEGHERVIAACEVLTALAPQSSLRTGEIARLRVRDIVDLGARGMLVEVRRIRNRPALKTVAAARSFVIDADESVEVLRSWIRRRKLEGAKPSDCLLGHCDKPDVPFRWGATLRLWTRALRLGTGDPDLVPHGIRHAVASLRIEAPQFWEQQAEVEPMLVLMDAMGHAAVQTTQRDYAHLWEAPIRAVAGGIIERLKLNSTILSRWTGTQANTIRVRLHRDRKSKADVWKQGVHGEAPAAIAKQVLPLLGQPCVSHGEAISRFEQMIDIADDWSCGYSLQAISLRRSLTQPDVERATQLIAKACLQSQSARGRRGARAWPAWANEEVKFTRLRTGNWKSLAARANTWTAAERADVPVWLVACARGGVDLEGSPRVGNLLVKMRDAGWRGWDFVERCENLGGLDRVDVRSVFAYVAQDVFAVNPPPVEQISPRRGRPRRYLLPLTKPLGRGQSMASAQSDYKSLLGFLVLGAAWTYHLMKEND